MFVELFCDRGYSMVVVGKWYFGEQLYFFLICYGFDWWFGLLYLNDMDWLCGFDFEEIFVVFVEGWIDDFVVD